MDLIFQVGLPNRQCAEQAPCTGPRMKNALASRDIILYALVSRDIMLCPGFQGLYCMPWFPGILCYALVSRDIILYALVSRDIMLCPGFQGLWVYVVLDTPI